MNHGMYYYHCRNHLGQTRFFHIRLKVNQTIDIGVHTIYYLSLADDPENQWGYSGNRQKGRPMEVYLDNSSTTQPAEVAVNAVNQALTECYANPSSLHHRGLEAEHMLKTARSQVAAVLGRMENEILLTSGGTESNNLAILGTVAGLRDKTRPLVTSQIEHPSILNIFKHLEKAGWNVIYLPVDQTGHLDLESLQKAVRQNPALISIMTINNEIGAIQPIAEIGQILATLPERPVFHTDAVQAFGKIELNPDRLRVDLLSFSGHKFHSPKGTGGLFIRKGTKLLPVVYGGSQENGLRPGTENTPGIAGMGAAAAWIMQNFSANQAKFTDLKQRLISGICERIPDVRINSPVSPDFAPHILNISFRGVRGEVLLHSLEQDGIYVSTRSACTSRKKSVSHVLQALHLTPDEIEGTIRISFGCFNDASQIDYVLERLTHHVNSIRRITGWRG